MRCRLRQRKRHRPFAAYGMVTERHGTLAGASLHQKSYDANASGPLNGLRVLDLSRLFAGNVLTQMLGFAPYDPVVVDATDAEGGGADGTRVEAAVVVAVVGARRERHGGAGGHQPLHELAAGDADGVLRRELVRDKPPAGEAGHDVLTAEH